MKYRVSDIAGFLYSERIDSESAFDSLYRAGLHESSAEFVRLFHAVHEAHADEEGLHAGTLIAGFMLWG
jgi:hypothetical protein